MADISELFSAVPRKRKVKIRSKNGIIFNNLNWQKRTVFYVANAIFLGGFIYLLVLYVPLIKAVINYWEIPANSSSTSNIAAAQLTPAPDNKYTLSIPKIGASTEIIPDVSPFDRTAYLKVLENNVVAQARNSSFPDGGMGTSSYIFAHSTQMGIGMVAKNAVFYLLGELKNEDPVLVSYKGKVYEYTVYDRKIVSADDVKYISYTEPDKEILMLQTCWPIGTDWKRLLIFAKLKQ